MTPMKGQKSSMGSLPDTISLDHNPTVTDQNIEQPVFWSNNVPNYAHNMVHEYLNPATNNGRTYLNATNQAQNLSVWNMGESSSSGTQNEYTPNNDVSIGGVVLNQTNTRVTNSPLFMQSARNNPFRQDLNLGADIRENNSDNRELLEGYLGYPSSASGGYFGEQTYSSEGRRLSCKRKAMEGHIGQSSSSGSSSYSQQREANEWNDYPDWNNTHFGSNTSNALLGNPIRSSPLETPIPINVTPNLETSRRNRRVRISSLPQQSPLPTILPIGNISSNSSVLTSPQSSLLVPRTPHTSRWNRVSSSRDEYSLNFGEGIARPIEEPVSNNLQLNIHENPIFLPTNATRNLSINGNSSRSVNPIPVPSGVSNMTPHSRRLAEFRRSLLSSPMLDSGGQSSNLPLQGVSSSRVRPSPGSVGNHVDRLSRLRSALLMERQLDSALGGASSLRSATAGSQGRSRLVSEIRNVLDLMRRGEGLRMEDLAILDQSVFFGRADIHDQHRDMRLDVDNMSYEELLALEERIGNVNTGLSEEMILDRLKQRKFFSIAMGAQSEVEPCCICQEEYNDGEDIGTVECGHEFHSGCIKQWLMLKNSCPICKTTALNK